jgi:hypothetical protein
MYINFINDRKYLGYEVYEFVLPSKVKGKTKKVLVVICLGIALCFNNIKRSEAIDLSVVPKLLGRVQPSYQHDFKVEIAKVIPRKKDLIFYKSPKEILSLMYLTDPRLSLNQQVLKLVKDLRGGNFGAIGSVALIVMII